MFKLFPSYVEIDANDPCLGAWLLDMEMVDWSVPPSVRRQLVCDSNEVTAIDALTTFIRTPNQEN